MSKILYFIDISTRIYKNIVVQYFCLGVIFASIDILLFYLFVEIILINWIYVSIFNFLILGFSHYVISKKFIFKIRKKNKLLDYDVVLIYMSNCFALSINIFIIMISTKIFAIDIILSKCIAILLVFIWNYSIRRFYIFK